MPTDRSVGRARVWRCSGVLPDTDFREYGFHSSPKLSRAHQGGFIVATIFYERDANPNALKGKTIAVFGYGSQGHAQAQNLRDSGYNVLIGLDPNRGSAKQAQADGMTIVAPAEAAKRADWIQILTPDETQADFY